MQGNPNPEDLPSDTIFMLPEDFPVTAKAESIGIILSVRGGDSFHVVLTWNQIERAREKAENPFWGMTAAQISTYLSREEEAK